MQKSSNKSCVKNEFADLGMENRKKEKPVIDTRVMNDGVLFSNYVDLFNYTLKKESSNLRNVGQFSFCFT